MEPPEWLTIDKYRRLKDGMSYAEVAGIFGLKCEVIHNSKIDYDDKPIEISAYKRESRLKIITCMFWNGKLV